MAIEEYPLIITVEDGQTTNQIVHTWVKNGRLRSVFLTAPVLANSKTATVAIDDADGFNIYTSSSAGTGATVGENTASVERELYGTVTLSITITGAQSGAKEFTLKFITETVAG